MAEKLRKIEVTTMHATASTIVMRRAKRLRQNMTEAEIKLWGELRLKKLGVKYRRQHPIANYILDFYCHSLRLSIELDGEYHQNEKQTQKDKERTSILCQLGIVELRFKNDEVRNEMSQVLRKIKLEINRLQNER